MARTEHFVMHGLALSSEASLPSMKLFSTVGPWLGALAPKRWAKRAVTRNLIKRQIFSMGEQHLDVTEGAYLVRLRAAYAREQFCSAASDVLRHAVRSELELLFKRAFKQSSAQQRLA